MRSSPGVPGFRPSNSSDASVLMCSRICGASIFGMPASGIFAAGAAVAAGGSARRAQPDRLTTTSATSEAGKDVFMSYLASHAFFRLAR